MTIDLTSIYEAAEESLVAQLKAIRAAFRHAGMKGSSVEAAIRRFLEDLLPQNIAVGSGVIVDSRMNVSRQLDVILYDRARTPIFFNAEGLKLIPIECVYFVIEVKTALDKGTFQEIEANVDSVKGLVPSAYYFDPSPIEHTKTPVTRAQLGRSSISLLL
jgi:hypothetical protein